MDKQVILDLIDAELAKADADLSRHINNVTDYLERRDYHGVWDFGVECQNAKDTIIALTRLREKVAAL